MITQEFLINRFEYRDGHLYYKETVGKNRKGSRAGTYRKNDNAFQVIIHKKHYLLHRLVFLYHNGFLPQYIDHINGNRFDNRIENLREATIYQNAQNARVRKNTKSGIKNVIWNKTDKSWSVKLQANKHRITVGQFKDLELAELVAIEARNKFHGKFANHGNFAAIP